MHSVIPEMLGGARSPLSRNTSSPDNSLGLGSFPLTACRTVLPVGVFPLHQTCRSEYLNKYPVGVEHRMDLDTYGTFCITVPLQQVVAIVEELRKSNRDWERRANSDPQASRDLNVRQTIGSLYNIQPYISPR